MAGSVVDLAAHRGRGRNKRSTEASANLRQGVATEKETAARRQGRCPTCGGAPVERFHPFCSRRCADIDLGRWLKEGYRIPGDKASAGEGDDTAAD